jgi:fructuronate reductase
MLNGAHSLLAYSGSIRGHETIDEAIADPTCRAWVEQYWDEAGRHLDLPPDEVAAYRAALVERFSNPRVRHRLAQIAADGSTKLVRLLPTIRAERAAGRVPEGCATAVAAWVLHLRGRGAPVNDTGAAAAQEAASAGGLAVATSAVLDLLGEGLGADVALVAAIVERAELVGTDQ